MWYIKPVKVRPSARAVWSEGNDGWDARYKVGYMCPTCSNTINERDIACDECGTFFDWSKKAVVNLVPQIEWR